MEENTQQPGAMPPSNGNSKEVVELFRGFGYSLLMRYQGFEREKGSKGNLYDKMFDFLFRQTETPIPTSFGTYLVKNLIETCLESLNEKVSTSDELKDSRTTGVILGPLLQKAVEDTKEKHMNSITVDELKDGFLKISEEYRKNNKLQIFEPGNKEGLAKIIQRVGESGDIDSLVYRVL